MCSNSGSTANTDEGLVEEGELMFTCFQVKGGLEMDGATLGRCASRVSSPMLSYLTEDI